MDINVKKTSKNISSTDIYEDGYIRGRICMRMVTVIGQHAWIIKDGVMYQITHLCMECIELVSHITFMMWIKYTPKVL